MFTRSYNTALNIIAPPFCAYCKMFLSERNVFCVTCAQKIQPIVSINLQITKTHDVKVFAVAGYSDPLKKLILAKGWSDISASNQLGQLTWDMTNIRHIDFDCIVPIPLHWMRFAKRGYNQAAEIAYVIAQQSGKPVFDILKRIKRTQFQSGLVHAKRADNVKDAFIVRDMKKTTYKSNHILLVDDLMTTGATLKATAKELLKLRPRAVTIVVVCRVV